MTDPAALKDILSTYRKYGWVLRRILVKDKSDADAISALSDPDDVEVSIEGVSAAWFSRPGKQGPVAWEIRYLGDPPFALLENLDERSPDFEGSLKALEDRLREAISQKR